MIGIIGAMEEEVQGLKAVMEDVRTDFKAGMKFVCGKLSGRDVVVVRSGIGKVNAAICAQILIDVYGVTTILNTGIAGGLYKDIEIGDMVISKEAMYHDVDATGFGYEKGVIPRMEVSVFPADKFLAEKALRTAERVNSDIRTFFGRIVTGDQFIAAGEKRKVLAEEFQGYCAEMEGAAIAHTAYLNGVKFLIIRAISDKADNSASMDYKEFEEKAIARSLRLVTELISEL